MKIRRTLEKSIAVIFSIVFAVCSFFTLFHFENIPSGFITAHLKRSSLRWSVPEF